MRFRTAVLLAFCLLWVALQPSPTTRNEVRSMSVGQPQIWDSLPAAVDSQTWWYATLPEPTTTTITPLRRSGTVSAAATGGSHKGYATAKDCVAHTENGGDYGRSSNPTHFGRYQFSRGAWASFGGDPNTWGSASPAEQDRVFENAWSQGETVQEQQWLRWDGC